MSDLRARFERMPLIGVLRGITPADAVQVVATMVDLGVRVIEVSLSSPDAFRSVRLIADSVPEDALIGCGTVSTTEQIDRAIEAGAKLIVSPHSDTELVIYAKRMGLLSIPGVATSTDAFSMIKSGADALKFFPAGALGASVLAAIRVVLPPETIVTAFGGVTKQSVAEYWKAGADAFGAGSSLYRPGWTAQQVRDAAAPLIEAIQDLARDRRNNPRGEGE